MRLLPVLLLLLSLGFPLVAAQVPTEQPCGPLVATATAPGTPVAPGSRADVTVNVANNGRRAAETTVAVSPLPPESGWTLVTAQELTQPIAPGDSMNFVFTVAPTDAARDDLDLSFATSGACALPVGVPNCPANTCTASANAVGARVSLARPQGGGIPGLEGLDLSVEYLVAGIVLVGVAVTIPFLLRRKPGGFVADCPEPLKLVRPGRGTSFPIEVRNVSPEPLTAQFEIGPVPDGWTAFMPLPEVQLAGREARSLWLMVRAPPAAVEGDAAEVELRLRNLARPDAGATVRVRAEVNPSAAEGAVGA